eukprot:3447021-Pyramimonas_sp.AAC.1
MPVISLVSEALVSDNFAQAAGNFETVLTSSLEASSSDSCFLLGGASATALASPWRFRPQLGAAGEDMAASMLVAFSMRRNE